jgi:hypothetical protein
MNTNQERALQIMSKVHEVRISSTDSKGNIYTYNYNVSAKFFYFYIVTVRGGIALINTFKATKAEKDRFKGMIAVNTKKVQIQAAGTIS